MSKKSREELEALVDNALALFGAPTSENDGGPGDLLLEIKTLQENYKTLIDRSIQSGSCICPENGPHDECCTACVRNPD